MLEKNEPQNVSSNLSPLIVQRHRYFSTTAAKRSLRLIIFSFILSRICFHFSQTFFPVISYWFHRGFTNFDHRLPLGTTSHTGDDKTYHRRLHCTDNNKTIISDHYMVLRLPLSSLFFSSPSLLFLSWVRIASLLSKYMHHNTTTLFSWCQELEFRFYYI